MRTRCASARTRKRGISQYYRDAQELLLRIYIVRSVSIMIRSSMASTASLRRPCDARRFISRASFLYKFYVGGIPSRQERVLSNNEKII